VSAAGPGASSAGHARAQDARARQPACMGFEGLVPAARTPARGAQRRTHGAPAQGTKKRSKQSAALSRDARGVPARHCAPGARGAAATRATLLTGGGERVSGCCGRGTRSRRA
jgi:hypothetical protein